MSVSRVRYSAFDTALYFLTFKDRTIKEIKDKLKEKGYSDSDIEDALVKLIDYGYINEKNYAFSYIKSNMNKKGAKLITMELIQKGLDKGVIMEQLSYFQDDEEDIVYSSVCKKYKDVDLDDEKQRRRVFSYFVRRGFKYESVSSALSKYRKNIIKNL